MTELWKLPAQDISRLVSTRKISATEVTQSVLERLDAVNPLINAVVAEFPEEALNAARTVDEAIARDEFPGLLAGVPVTIKENVDQAGHATNDQNFGGRV